MLTHAEKAAAYSRAIYSLEADGWTKGELFGPDGSSCLVGVLQRSSYSDNLELQKEVADELIKRYVSVRVISAVCAFTDSDRYGVVGGEVQVVERWNDRKRRRKSQVLRVLKRLQTRHESLAKSDREAQLRTQIRMLQDQLKETRTQVARLELENAQLIGEVRFWKSRRARVTADELRESSEDLASLDAELDAAMAELRAVESR